MLGIIPYFASRALITPPPFIFCPSKNMGCSNPISSPYVGLEPCKPYPYPTGKPNLIFLLNLIKIIKIKTKGWERGVALVP